MPNFLKKILQETHNFIGSNYGRTVPWHAKPKCQEKVLPTTNDPLWSLWHLGEFQKCLILRKTFFSLPFLWDWSTNPWPYHEMWKTSLSYRDECIEHVAYNWHQTVRFGIAASKMGWLPTVPTCSNTQGQPIGPVKPPKGAWLPLDCDQQEWLDRLFID